MRCGPEPAICILRGEILQWRMGCAKRTIRGLPQAIAQERDALDFEIIRFEKDRGAVTQDAKRPDRDGIRAERLQSLKRPAHRGTRVDRVVDNSDVLAS